MCSFSKKEVVENATSLKKAMSDNDTIFQINVTSSRFRTHPFTSAANEYGKLASSKMSALKCFKKVAFSFFSSDTRRKKHKQKTNIIVPLSKDLLTYENSLYSINFPSVFVTKPKFL